MRSSRRKEYSKANRSNKDILSKQMAIAVKTLRKYSVYMSTPLVYEYTNGVIEGLNNKIKVIKKVDFGYRRFDNMKKSILDTHSIIK
ncbi:MAG: transposase [Lachnospirales bacterium]